MTNTREALKGKKTGYNFRVVWEALADARARLQGMTDQEAEAFFHAPQGNSKTGAIPAWSLLPGAACPGRACAGCLVSGCYALKNVFRAGYSFTPSPDTGRCNRVLRNWAENTALVLDRLPLWSALMWDYLAEYAASGGKLFRIHASGDFISPEYADAWARLAEDFPEVRFLAFTKFWENIRGISFPANFSLVLSAWPGMEVPEDLATEYRVSWCQDGTEDRVPEDAMHCPGDCDSCGLCWYLAETGRDVWFTKH